MHPSRFTLQFSLDNDAFHTPAGPEEIARILEGIANTVREGEDGGAIVDINGNTVGRWDID